MHADQLAKRGSTIDPGPHTVSTMPQATLLDKLNQYFTALKLPRWRGTHISDQSKNLLSVLLEASKNNLLKLSNTLISLKTEDLKILMKTITGANCLHYYQHIIGNVQTDECTYCILNEIEKLRLDSYGKETATHLLCECQFFSRLRQEIYGKTSISIDELGNSSLRLTIKNMIKFMSKTGALTRAPIYPASQISPKISKKTWKRFLDDAQESPTDLNTQPEPKQRKLSHFFNVPV